jgi:glycosyltransferase involved in cell wall biosynthesis
VASSSSSPAWQPVGISLLLPDLAGGGAERVMLLLAAQFAKLGHPVDLLLGRVEGPYLNAIPDNVRVVDLSGPGWPRSTPSLALAMAGGLRRYLAETSASVLMSSITGANLIACATVPLAARRPRLVIREASISANRKSALRTLACRLLYPRADAFIGNSKGVVEDLVRDLRVDGRKVHMIHNPIDLEFARCEAGGQSPHPWLEDGGPPVVLGMGRLSREKGFDLLLQAMAVLTRRCPARLILLGDGPEASALRQQAFELGISELTQFPGFQSNPYRWLGRCDVFCLSSRWEGFPQALAEALSLGRRVVASDCRSGPREILEGGRPGVLVPVGSAEALADGIAQALIMAHNERAQRARVQHFAMAGQAEKYLRILLPDHTAENNPESASSEDSPGHGN